MFRKVDVELSLTNRGFLTGLGQSAAATRQFERDLRRTALAHSDMARQVGRGMLIAGGVMAVGLGLAMRSAIQFDAELRNVATISSEVRDNLASTSQVLRDMAGELPQDAHDLAKGLYDIASSGFQGAAGLEVLEQSAVGASAGLSSTATAAGAITSVLNAYGLSAAHAADVNDILFQTVNLGVVTFEQLASSIGDVVGLAAQAGVSFDQVGGAIATMTRVGVGAEESVTSLNRVFQAFISPSDAMAQKMAELGISMDSLADPAIGLEGVMHRIREATGGSVVELRNLFPEIRGLRGALALTSNQGRTYAEVNDGITDSVKRAEAAQKALKIQSEGAGYQMKIAGNEIQSAGIALTTSFLPVIKVVAETVGNFAGVVGSLPEPLLTTVTALGGLVAVTLLAGGAYNMLTPRLATANAYLVAMGPAGAIAATGLKAVTIGAATILPLLALVAIGMTIFGSKQEEGKDYTLELVDALKAEKKALADLKSSPVEDVLIKGLVEKGLVDDVEALGINLVDLIGAMRGTEGAAEAVAAQVTRAFEGIDPASEKSRELRESFSNLFGDVHSFGTVDNPMSQMAVTAGELSGEFGNLRGQVQSAQGTLDDTKDVQVALAEAQGKGALATQELDDTHKALAKTMLAFLDPAQAYADALEKIEDRQAVLASGADVWSKAVSDATEAMNDAATAAAEAHNDAASKAAQVWNRTHKGAIDRREADRKSAEDFKREVHVGLVTYDRALRNQVEMQLRWEADLLTITRRAGPDVAAQLREMGEEGVDLVRQMAGGTDAQVSSIATSLRRLAPEARITLAAYTAELQSQVTAQEQVFANLAILAKRGFAGLAQELFTLGPEYAPLIAEAAKGDKAALDKLEKLLAAKKGFDERSGLDLQKDLQALEAIATGQGITVEQLKADLDVTEVDLELILARIKDDLRRLPPEKVIHIRWLYDPIPAGPGRPVSVATPPTGQSGSTVGYEDRTASGPLPLVPQGTMSGTTGAYDNRYVQPLAPAGGARPTTVVAPVSSTRSTHITIERLEVADPAEFQRWTEAQERQNALAGSP